MTSWLRTIDQQHCIHSVHKANGRLLTSKETIVGQFDSDSDFCFPLPKTKLTGSALRPCSHIPCWFWTGEEGFSPWCLYALQIISFYAQVSIRNLSLRLSTQNSEHQKDVQALAYHGPNMCFPAVFSQNSSKEISEGVLLELLRYPL